MPRAPRLTGKQLIALLEEFGFEVVRVRGSHHSSAMKMAERPSFLSMATKSLALAYLARYAGMLR